VYEVAVKLSAVVVEPAYESAPFTAIPPEARRLEYVADCISFPDASRGVT